MYEYQREGQANDRRQETMRQKMDYRKNLHFAVLAKALSSYSQAKKCRRMLCARAIRLVAGTKCVLADCYDDYMDCLNDAQLEIENLVRDVQTSASAFANASLISIDLRSLESYLKKLIEQYKTLRPHFSAAALASMELAQLPTLEAFLGPSDGSEFKRDFLEPYKKIQTQIRGDLLRL